MDTVKFRFFRSFDWLGPGRKCQTCKAIWAFLGGTTDTIPEAAAIEAEKAGAGERVE